LVVVVAATVVMVAAAVGRSPCPPQAAVNSNRAEGDRHGACQPF
jgi:hypothetical protein